MELIALLAAILGVSLHSSQTLTLPDRFQPNPSFHLPAAHTILEAGSLIPAYVSDLGVGICRNRLVELDKGSEASRRAPYEGKPSTGNPVASARPLWCTINSIKCAMPADNHVKEATDCHRVRNLEGEYPRLPWGKDERSDGIHLSDTA